MKGFKGQSSHDIYIYIYMNRGEEGEDDEDFTRWQKLRFCATT